MPDAKSLRRSAWGEPAERQPAQAAQARGKTRVERDPPDRRIRMRNKKAPYSPIHRVQMHISNQ